MPIKASADKIRNELAQFGNPPVFPVIDEAAAQEAAEKKVGCGSSDSPASEWPGQGEFDREGVDMSSVQRLHGIWGL
jgi:hypothetical protein